MCVRTEAFSIAEADGTSEAFAESFTSVTQVGNCYGGEVTAEALATASAQAGFGSGRR